MKTSLYTPWPTIDVGLFRHKITLLEQVPGIDAAGSNVAYLPGNPIVTAWANIEYVHGLELIRAGQDVTQAFLKITSWWRTEFTVNSRIQAPSGNQYIIQAFENVKEMNTYMVLMCLGIGDNT